jgi:hypothetical protein
MLQYSSRDEHLFLHHWLIRLTISQMTPSTTSDNTQGFAGESNVFAIAGLLIEHVIRGHHQLTKNCSCQPHCLRIN